MGFQTATNHLRFVDLIKMFSVLRHVLLWGNFKIRLAKNPATAALSPLEIEPSGTAGVPTRKTDVAKDPTASAVISSYCKLHTFSQATAKKLFKFWTRLHQCSANFKKFVVSRNP